MKLINAPTPPACPLRPRHQVTTKKGYDGCRKADYLFAHQPITDKTFASLGETTIANLKATFHGVDTGACVGRVARARAALCCCTRACWERRR